MPSALPLLLLVGAGAFLLRKDTGTAGYTGPLDTAVQRKSALATLGLYKGIIDDAWGDQAQSGISALQKANGWPVTGQWSPEVDSGIRSLLPPEWTPSPMGTSGLKAVAGSSGYPTLSIDQMKGVQRQLMSLGHYDGGIDGRYTQATKAAVEKFQNARGIQANGMPGTDTLSALDGAAPSAEAAPLKDASSVPTIAEISLAQPSPQASDIASGEESGLTWKIWTEPSGPPYAQWQNAIRNPAGKLVKARSYSTFTIGDAINKQQAMNNEHAQMLNDIAELTTPPLSAEERELLRLPPIQSWQVGFNANLSNYALGSRWQDRTLDNWLNTQRKLGLLATKYDEVSAQPFILAYPQYSTTDMFARVKIINRTLSVGNFASKAGLRVATALASTGMTVAPLVAGALAGALVAYWGLGIVVSMMDERHRKVMEGSAAVALENFLNTHYAQVHGADGPILLAELPHTRVVVDFLEEITFYIARFQSSSFA